MNDRITGVPAFPAEVEPLYETQAELLQSAFEDLRDELEFGGNSEELQFLRQKYAEQLFAYWQAKRAMFVEVEEVVGAEPYVEREVVTDQETIGIQLMNEPIGYDGVVGYQMTIKRSGQRSSFKANLRREADAHPTQLFDDVVFRSVVDTPGGDIEYEAVISSRDGLLSKLLRAETKFDLDGKRMPATHTESFNF